MVRRRSAAGSPVRRRVLAAAAAAAVGVLLLGVVSAALDLPPLFDDDIDGFEDPASVQPPPGLDLPEAPVAPPVARATREAAPDAAAVSQALAGLVAAPRLGGRVAVQVAALDSPTPVYRHGVRAVVPASTLKLLTALAALEALGPDRRFTTAALRRGGRVTLVGGGDPLLARAPPADPDTYPARADLTTLARATARELTAAGRTRVTLRYDAGLFTGPAFSPGWEPGYREDDVVSPIVALWADQGRLRAGESERVADPAATAAAFFARQLGRRGVVVRGEPRPGVAGERAEEAASVASAPVRQVVQHVLAASDNEASEVLARHVALARDLAPSFGGGARAVLGVLTELGVRTAGASLDDASGLSRGNRLRPQTLLDVLAVAASSDHPELRAAVTGLPVAGFTGSLAYRFDTGAPAGLGLVRAKTGTLTGVHGLAGVVTTRDEVVLSFVAVADRVAVADTLFARARLDQIAAALARCVCGSP